MVLFLNIAVFFVNILCKSTVAVKLAMRNQVDHGKFIYLKALVPCIYDPRLQEKNL